MIGDLQVQLEACKQAGIAALKQIEIKSIDGLKAINSPPQIMFTVLQYVQIILAGNLSTIEVNPAANQPKSNGWTACRKMLLKQQPGYFLDTCLQIFNKFHEDPFLDMRVQTVSQKMETSGLHPDKVKFCSSVCDHLFAWLQNVVKYWRLLKEQKK